MTLPGNARVDVTGLTFAVGRGHPPPARDYARDDGRAGARLCALAAASPMILTASEGGIYPRFGYGVATTARKIAIERAAARYPAAAPANTAWSA